MVPFRVRRTIMCALGRVYCDWQVEAIARAGGLYFNPRHSKYGNFYLPDAKSHDDKGHCFITAVDKAIGILSLTRSCRHSVWPAVQSGCSEKIAAAFLTGRKREWHFDGDRRGLWGNFGTEVVKRWPSGGKVGCRQGILGMPVMRPTGDGRGRWRPGGH